MDIRQKNVDNCQKNVNLSTEREFIHTMDNCLWHGQAMKCPPTVCQFVSLVVSGQNFSQDLDLSRKILTSLTDFLGPRELGNWGIGDLEQSVSQLVSQMLRCSGEIGELNAS